jgi:hypothetical protein
VPPFSRAALFGVHGGKCAGFAGGDRPHGHHADRALVVADRQRSDLQLIHRARRLLKAGIGRDDFDLAGHHVLELAGTCAGTGIAWPQITTNGTAASARRKGDRETTVLESIELHVPLAGATERGSELREALLRTPGVHSVGPITPEEIAALARVVVGYDPGITNPIVIRDQLATSGFAVTLAAERPE